MLCLPEVLMLTLSVTDGTVVYSFALNAGFCFRMVLQDSRKGPCLCSATLAVLSQVELFGGKGETASRDMGGRTQGRYGTCSMRTNGVAPRKRKFLHTYIQASGDKEVVSYRPQWNYGSFLQPRKEQYVPRQ